MPNFFKKIETFYWLCPSAHQDMVGYGYIKLSVIIDNKRSVFSTGILCHKNHWRPGKLFRILPEDENGDEKTFHLKCIMQRVEEIKKMMRQKRMEPTAKNICDVLRYLDVTEPGENATAESKLHEGLWEEDFINALSPIEKKKAMTLMEVLRTYHSIKKKDTAPNTHEGYNTREKRIEDYLKIQKKADLAATDFTAIQANLFADYLYDDDMEKTSIKLYMNNYRAALKYAASRGLIPFNPLSEFEYKADVVLNHDHLTLEHLNALDQYKSADQHDKEFIKALLFMIHTGLHWIDYHTLTRKDVVIRDGTVWLEKKREKSKVEYCQKMHPEALKILSEYGNPENMPKFEYNEMRLKAESLGEKLGLEIKFRLKVCRKTFAFLCLNVWRLSLETTAKMMGLNNTATIAFYARVGQTRVDSEVNW